ncbi:MAG TPA: metalloregulator ArsR/SmtB family transcription factor [Fimbriimonadaceae bacterium]|nr:metalloregulator ArsR/SmtB family transcription factor [Fimbriimonadaceae bacterium]
MAIDSRAFERVAKALAEPTRVEMLKLISARPGITCGEIVTAVSVGQSTVSHHLKELVEAELITGEKDGQCMRLQSNPETLRSFLESLDPLARS